MPWFDVALTLLGALFGLWIAVNPDQYRRMGLRYVPRWARSFVPGTGVLRTAGVFVAVVTGLLFSLGLASHC
jgi:hypothetical protein